MIIFDGWLVEVCRVILSMLCIMGGIWVCYIVGMCILYTMGSRE